MSAEKRIIIQGGTHKKIVKALRQWLDLYGADFKENLRFELYKHSDDEHTILTDTRLDNDRFFYLINYLAFPEGINYEVELVGYTKGARPQLSGKELMIYLSKKENQNDNVYVVSSDQMNYKIEFGGRVSVINDSKQFLPYKIKRLSNPEVFYFKEEARTNPVEEYPKALKRFKIYAAFVFVASLASLTTPYFTNEVDLYGKVMLILFIIFSVWLLMDDEMLKFDNLYFACLLISILLLGFGYYVSNFAEPMLAGVVSMVYFQPICFLIVQWPLRRLYKLIFKREPIVETYYGRFADICYSGILIGGLIFLPIIIYEIFIKTEIVHY